MAFNPTVSGISGASDVALSNKADTHVLMYSSTIDKWINAAVPAGNPTMGGDLTGTASNAQIASEAVGTAELGSGAVTDAKVATGISQSKIANLTTDLASKASSATTISVTNSLTGGGSLAANRTISLVGDMTTPGASRYYGTDSSGARGFYALPAGVSGATASTLGTIMLTGDLGGTASSPTVPGLASKANTTHTHAATDITSGTIAVARLGSSGTPSSSTYLRGDNTWATVASGETNTASNVGIGGIGVFKQKTGANLEFKNINAGSNKISVTNDATNNEIDIDVQTANLGLTKADVGLSNVDNTSDANKPISSLTQTALNGKANNTVSISVTNSLSGGGDLSANRTISLVGDTTTPGASRYYGTDSSGTRGFYALPVANPSMGGDLTGTASNAQLAAGVVGTAELADGSITEPKLNASNTPTSGQMLTWNGTALAWSVLPPGRETLLTTVSGNTNAANGNFLLCNAASSGFTVTLPAPTNGAFVGVKKIDTSTNAVVVMRSGVLIDDQVSISVNDRWESYDFMSDGVQWWRV